MGKIYQRSLHSILVAIILCFSFTTQAQTITITQPNGGEVLYACQQYPVQWTQTGSPSNYWNIDYSLDGGTIWASVATNYLSTNGQFLWTVPTIQSNTVLLRVYDAQAPGTTDQSNNYFTINIPVTVTSPNGGEIWQGNTVHNITWNAQGTSNKYNIAYSINGGSSWTNIVTNHSNLTGSYAWTVPALALNTNCLVRVQDYTQNCMQDVSNTAFTITPAKPVLTSPNGGEVYRPNCQSYYISWNTASIYTSTVRLDLSVNGGATWVTVANNLSNTGAYFWTIPNLPSSNCLVRLSNYNDLTITDTSDAPFTIAPTIITTPNGGQTLVGCSTVPITFSKSTCVGSWYLSYSIDSGATFTAIATVSDNGSTLQTYNWVVPNGITSSKALVKVMSGSYPTINDTSNAVFNIIPSNDITVTSPNGGEVWQGLTQQTITWTNLPSASGQYNLQYSIDGGNSWTNIVSNITGNSYNWTVPNRPSTNCFVRVVDYVNNCKYDVNNAAFTITPAKPVLISPNGGEVYRHNCQSYYISWNTASIYTSTVRLDLSVNGGSTWITVANNLSNTGAYFWTVPTFSSSNCLVRLSNYNDLTLTDTSDASFTIAPTTITTPNGGQTLVGCSTVPITFTKSTCVGSWYLSYSIDSGATFTAIATVSDNGSTIQTYNWVVPNGITNSKALVKVMSGSYPAVNDTSNAVFNIIPSNDITVTAPNGGEVWQGLTQQTITWTNLPSASGQYNLQYSIDGGNSWTNIVSNITGNSYNWTVPNRPSTNCFVRVVDYVNNCKYDVNNASFTITPAKPVLISPNGGEVYRHNCQSYYISWNTASIYTSTVRLDLSVNGGSTWITVANNLSNTGAYFWTVPTFSSSNCLVRLSNYNDLTLTDTSDASFTIAPTTITTPNGGQTLVGCSTVPITFSKSTCVGSWYLSYSIDSGATYTSIATVSDNGSTLQTYNWVVPNGITSSKALVKVMSGSYPAVNDTSNAVFNIIPSNDITVTAPNGGEVWQGLTQQTITWTNLPSASGQYNLQYSIDGGNSWTNIVSNITGNSYSWTVPNRPSTNCFVRVVDYVNNCKYDVNNASFTITPAKPVLISPNGGEVYRHNCQSYYISWNTASIYTSTVRLDLSVNGGSTWITVANNLSNTGAYFWTVPTFSSSNCLVRLSNYNDLTLTDTSNATFTIALTTITTPNGGQTLVGCSTVPITFTKSTCVGSWYLSYSIDSGATFTAIATVSDNGSTIQTYNWVVPNGITNSKALVKVMSGSYPAVNDTSNAVFNIIPSNDITVTAPNGGEVWQGLTQQTITWTNLPSASGQYNLQYSIDGGNSWTNIVSNITGNSYNWTVPNRPSTNCFVRVVDYVNNCKYDVNNASFTITPAKPVLISPNGGEVYRHNCQSYYISWNTASIYTSTVRLDLSVNGGSTWITVANNLSNTGAYFWTVPTFSSSNCLVRLSNYNDLTLTDTSDASFTIAPTTITTPNGGQTLVGCSTVPITFSKSTCVGSWYLSYSIDSGATYTSIATVSDNGSTLQTYNWVVPNGITSSKALVKVMSGSYPTINDTSNAVFNIIPSNDITVTSPNGGEVWQGLTQQTITWTNLPSASGQYNLQYSIDGGNSWTNIVSNITGNSYNWTVPNRPSTNCFVRVVDYNNTCKYDFNNTAFTITPAKPVLTAPNGGEVWYSGISNYITWNTTTIYTSTVRLEYSLDGGNSWVLIINNVSNSGAYNWTIPNVSSTNALVRISNYNDLSVTDVSNAVFTLKPAVTIITPNGGNAVTLGGCTVTSITFDRSPAWSSYYMEYSLNNGVTWNLITGSWTATTNPASYVWNVPNVFAENAKVRVTPTANSYSDISDNSFPIIKPVTLIQPNFGGIMQVGSTYEISWQSDGISNLYDIFYSINGGSSFTNIVTGYNTSNNKYNWTVPNNVSSNCRILIRDNVNTCKSDTSDLPFIISTTPAPISLLKPNGLADTLVTCNNYAITWNEPTVIGTYTIAYSTNSGASWTNIITNYATTSHSYDWTVPNNVSSNTVLLRVSSSSNATIYDMSDSYFSIMPLVYTFNGSGNWDEPSNWDNNLIPPTPFTNTCSEIIIDPISNGECILNVPQTMSTGTKITVQPGKKFRVPENLTIQN